MSIKYQKIQSGTWSIVLLNDVHRRQSWWMWSRFTKSIPYVHHSTELYSMHSDLLYSSILYSSI